jgi:hypothetical protein
MPFSLVSLYRALAISISLAQSLSLSLSLALSLAISRCTRLFTSLVARDCSRLSLHTALHVPRLSYGHAGARVAALPVYSRSPAGNSRRAASTPMEQNPAG